MVDLQSFFDYNECSLIGKRVLVTGASAGIGLATACRLASEGCHLFLVARRKERLDEIATQLHKRFPKIEVRVCACDVRARSCPSDLDKQGFLDVDILINNAGLARGLDAVETANLDHWDEMIDTNVTAAFRMVHAVLPHLIRRGGGHIINLSSIAGREVYEKGGVYCATKHALNAFTRALRQETCDKNIRVSLVSPGMVNTEFSLVRFSGDAERATSVYKGFDPLVAQDVAQAMISILKQPAHVNIDEIFITPAAQGSATKTHRRS